MSGEMAGRGRLVALPRSTRMRRRKLCVRSGAVRAFAVWSVCGGGKIETNCNDS